MCRRHDWVAAPCHRSTVGAVGGVGQPRPVLTAANPEQKETERDDHGDPPWSSRRLITILDSLGTGIPRIRPSVSAALTADMEISPWAAS